VIGGALESAPKGPRMHAMSPPLQDCWVGDQRNTNGTTAVRLRLCDEREAALRRGWRLANSNPLEESIYTPKRHTILPHCGA
jgi:hypothetical protein